MKKSTKIIIAIIIILVIVCGGAELYQYLNKEKSSGSDKNSIENTAIQGKNETKKSEYAIEQGLSNFDLAFLKIENPKENIIYSPLSIKYALEMLDEAADGESKEQISAILNDYVVKKYVNSKNLAFGNALFVRDSFDVKDSYTSLLKEKYNADVIKDSFKNASTINNWVSDKTLDLIKDLMTDEDVKNLDFALVNALGIDMDWNIKFFPFGISEDENISSETSLDVDSLEKEHKGLTSYCSYDHENYNGWAAEGEVTSKIFNNENEVSGMNIYATLNNYDIFSELGEENIRKTVSDAFIKWANSEDGKDVYADIYGSNDVQTALKNCLDGWTNEYGIESSGYMNELKKNYKNVSYSTDFSIYYDDNVKAFAKDLKEYDGTQLQYIGIMPTKESLDEYVKNTSSDEIKIILDNLKELKSENFKDGTVTEITGYIPKFKFDYTLDLINDLNKMGVKDVFTSGKANLVNLTDNESAFISDASHKATIEFTQDGIKASAATFMGGMGAGESFDYLFDVPVEKVDMTFDKPYMFIIRDKENGEVWFTGNVYEPLSWNEDVTKPEF